MARTIPQRELRNHNAAVVDAVVRGEVFVVTRDGTPVAELRPIKAEQRRLVPKRDIAAVAAGSHHLDAVAFRRDLDRVAGDRVKP